MEKGVGSKKIHFTLIFLSILIISISLVSAGFLSDVLSKLFPGLSSITGKATTTGGGTGSCTDSDGPNNFDVAGYVTTSDGQLYYDYCEGNIAYDYFCQSTNPDGTPQLSLPLITGKVISGGSTPPAKGVKNCASVGLVCMGGGICGCTAGTNQSCSTGINSPTNPSCSTGTMTCNSQGQFGSCINPGVPEICGNGIDDNCDGVPDSPGCQISCTDKDHDGYVLESVIAGCSTSSIAQFKGYNDCNDNNAAIHPGAIESCDGIDSNCNGKSDDTPGEVTCSEPGKTCQYFQNSKQWSCETSVPTCNNNGVCESGENVNNCPNDCHVCTPNSNSTTCGTAVCGTKTNNCNQTVDCGTCSAGQGCNAQGQCNSICDTNQEACTKAFGANYQCGTTINNCNSTVSCGSCSSGQTCNAQAGICAIINISTPCTDNDNDGYVTELSGSNCTKPQNFKGYGDCNDTDSSMHPDIILTCAQVNSSSNGGLCIGKVAGCVNGSQIRTCTQLGLKDKKTAEVCGDLIDDNCDPISSLVDGCTGCTDGDTSPCDTGNACEIGEQTCTDGTWGSCEVVDEVTNCNNATACNPGDAELCGVTRGECVSGYKSCKDDGAWGECNDKKPVAEICGNLKDDDCDGVIDNGCNLGTNETNNNQTNQSNNGNDAGSTNQGTTEQKSWFQIFLNILAKIFKFGQVLMGNVGTGAVTQASVHCSDSDGGVSYTVKGVGSGLNSQDKELWFQDTCYKDSLNNQVETCAGDSCFLIEYSCKSDQKHFTSESEVKCQFGCSKGACIPTREQSAECAPYLNEDVEWVYPCA